jgi:hypothetical protein|tara:strand:+ start:134 stop:682 length:549 start_codon:yes stop_codon:yes gene_type:complete
MDEEKGSVIEDYIKKGLEKGFSMGYIKETLVKHGHDSEKVEISANNVSGLKVPEELKEHVEEVKVSKQKYPVLLTVFVVILLLVLSFFIINYFTNSVKVEKVQSQLDEVQELGVSIDDLSTTMKTQASLIKEKDLTLDEKEKIIEDQIKLIDDINGKIKTQRTKINAILLDIMNRMIGRMSE